MQEPVLKIDNIQGNILGGFRHKRHRALVFIRIQNINLFREWLAAKKNGVTSSTEVIAPGRLRDSKPRRSWFNIAFSYNALLRLAEDANTFADLPFREGLAKRSALLGDPIHPDFQGHPRNWLVGAPGIETDAVLILADDDHRGLADSICRLRSEFGWTDRRLSVAKILFCQQEANGLRRGFEHFGFRDEISQPALRGRFSDDPRDFLTPRKRDDQTSVEELGQQLVWPGEFLFGYSKQDADKGVDHPGTNSLVGAGPKWIEDGSFLVIRRLRQDVHAFHTFLQETGRRIGLSPDLVAAKLMGRWAHGASVTMTPSSDDTDLATANPLTNDFLFIESTTSAAGDANGERCPFSAHIRKVNPRDVHSRSGDKFPNKSDSQTHRLLRRGIPYGEASASTPDKPVRDSIDRGLLFLSYQTSIQKQFEFVVRRWANETNFPEPMSGHDPIIGQNNMNRDRKRTFRLGPGHDDLVTTSKEWVIPTGGGYFFSPSINAIDILAKGS